MPPQVCWRCRQTYHDDDPRWGCACGPARPTALPPAVTHVANDDPATWYDAFTCYPPDGDLEALPWLRGTFVPRDDRPEWNGLHPPDAANAV